MTDFNVAGVVDPARYSERATVVIEVDTDAFNALPDDQKASMNDELAEALGMPCLVIVGGCLARIEEPASVYPRRDDSVAVWLKAKRDEYGPEALTHQAIDDLLDEWRLRADVGASLTDPTPPDGPWGYGG